MQSKETQTKNLGNRVSSVDNLPDDINPENSSKSEQITQIQRDSVITSQDLPSKRVRYGFTLLILSAFLFVVAIYYGIINP